MKITLLFVATVFVCQTSSFVAFAFKSDVYPYGPNQTEVEAALEKAREINLLKRGINFFERDYTDRSVHRCPLSFHHGIRQQGGDKVSEGKTNDALLAVRILMQEGGYTSSDLEQESVTEIFERMNGLRCNIPHPVKCVESSYRTADGSCNNIQNPNWGMAGNFQQRVISNDYDDKMGSPRTKGFKGKPLPNPRTVSNKVHQNPQTAETRSSTLTLHIMGFGQFLDHDIAITPEQETVKDCCDEKSKDDTDYCFNIIIPKSVHESSPIFVPGYCMEVKRSAPVFCKDAESRNKARQQTNGLTSFVDASNVYGSSSERQAKLRENGNGYRMDTTIFSREERILDSTATDPCVLTNAAQKCSLAGDIRVNEVPTLTSYHFLFVKEHNRIAELLKGHVTNDETLFQETRRIVIAIMQKIVYDEFLPAFFSADGLETYNLRSEAAYVYEPDTNPTLVNSFGIAYRYGHTWISQTMQLFNRNLKQIDKPSFTRNTEDIFLNPDMTYLPYAFKRLAYGLSGRSAPRTDNVLEEAVRSRLFINETDNLSFDLAALNIQRGRDHGLPSYNEYRKWCDLTEVNRKWKTRGTSGLIDHSPKMRNLLELAGYSSPRDIDLFTGGLTETNLPGGEIGPTFECIIGRHFRNLKFGDRFWYQNEDAGFTRDQIQAIQRYSLAGVHCNNYEFKTIHCPSVFRKKDSLTPCEEIPDLDLSVFKQRTPGDSDSSSEESESPDTSNPGGGWWWNKKRIFTETEEMEKNLGDDKDDEENVSVIGDLNDDDEDLNKDVDDASVDNEDLNIDADNAGFDNEDLNMDVDDVRVDNEDLNVDTYIERLIEELKRNKEKNE